MIFLVMFMVSGEWCIKQNQTRARFLHVSHIKTPLNSKHYYITFTYDDVLMFMNGNDVNVLCTI